MVVSSIAGYIRFVVISLSISLYIHFILSLSLPNSFSISQTLPIQLTAPSYSFFLPLRHVCVCDIVVVRFTVYSFLIWVWIRSVCDLCVHLPRLSMVSFWLLGFSAARLYAHRYVCAMGGVLLSWRRYGQSQSEPFKGVFQHFVQNDYIVNGDAPNKQQNTPFLPTQLGYSNRFECNQSGRERKKNTHTEKTNEIPPEKSKIWTVTLKLPWTYQIFDVCDILDRVFGIVIHYYLYL